MLSFEGVTTPLLVEKSGNSKTLSQQYDECGPTSRQFSTITKVAVGKAMHIQKMIHGEN